MGIIKAMIQMERLGRFEVAEMAVVFPVEKGILFEDKDLLVCYKEAGMPVQSAGFMVMDMEHALMNYLAGKQPGKMPYVAVVHRLDQPVEGILVFGKNQQAARKLCAQLNNGQMEKNYLAVVSGKAEKKAAALTDFLKKDGRKNCSFVVPKGEPGGKEARLKYEVLEEKETVSLLKVTLDTGRFHQIRVQLSNAGLPIVGDHKYGSGGQGGNLALCAFSLSFVHPRTGKKLCFQVKPKGESFHNFSYCEAL